MNYLNKNPHAKISQTKINFSVKENIEISINWVIEKLKIAPHDNLQQEILNRVFPRDS